MRPKYRPGLVPHYVDRGTRLSACEPRNKAPDVHDPLSFLKEMAECEVVASSSLHGLVFAEALGIPNLWVKASEEIAGGTFKFDDWFSTTREPQTAAHILTAQASVDTLIADATLHDSTIEPQRLMDAFPLNRIEEFRESTDRKFYPVSVCRTKPLPVFLISYDRGAYLQKAISSIAKQRRQTEIIVHDNGSTDLPTLAVLNDLEANGVRVLRQRPISTPEELNKVNDTVEAFYNDRRNPRGTSSATAISTCFSTDPDALGRLRPDARPGRSAEVAGPMLTIRDISRIMYFRAGDE